MDPGQRRESPPSEGLPAGVKGEMLPQVALSGSGEEVPITWNMPSGMSAALPHVTVSFMAAPMAQPVVVAQTGSRSATPVLGDDTGGQSADSPDIHTEFSAEPLAENQPQFIFALGRVEPRFTTLALEREFAQAAGRVRAEGMTDLQRRQAVLADRSNRYLVRDLCWIFLVGGIETYILVPRDPADFELLVQSLRTEPAPGDIDVVIGRRGPLAGPDVCQGLPVPLVGFDQLYSFDRGSLIRELPRPAALKEKDDDQFRATAEELFDRILQITDNAGSTDEHRALNYLAVRYPAIYARAAESYREDASLSAVEVRPSRLSGVRTVLDVIFSFTHRQTDVTEAFFVRVDVTEEYPFLVTKLSPYYNR